MNQNSDKQDTAFAILWRIWQPESRKATSVLVLSWAMILGWLYFGSADFFRQHFSAVETGGYSLDTLACLYEIGMAFLLLACLPLAFMKIVWGMSASELGLGIGSPRRWIPVLLAALPVLAVIAWFGSASVELQEIYPRDPTAGDSVSKFAMYAAARFLFYFAWEFHFRGFLQFSLVPTAGRETSCVVQAVACSIAHLRGPLNETIGAFVGGLWWGAHALGSRSIWGTTLQHWFLGITVDALICISV